MLFNSVAFLIFFPAVWALFHALRAPAARTLLLLAASYFFYAWWRVDYCLLLLASTLTDYSAALLIGRSAPRTARNLGLAVSLLVNVGLLCTFKYWALLGETVTGIGNLVGAPINWPVLDLLLPIGISFYTFQTISYTIDVYRGTIAPERNLARFALYVSFFPQLVAGPIERPGRLLPQLRAMNEATTDQFVSGLRLMLWGMFKKVVVADRLALVVNAVYAHPTNYNGTQLTIATIMFAMQIYCDFSGYTDIAIGCARTLGIDLMQNFRRPYLAWCPTEFWRRWHISLSSWFGDYVYKPLGGSRRGAGRNAANLLATFLVSGLWHGANWTFVIWGGVHGLLVLVERGARRLLGLSSTDAPARLGTRLLCTVLTLAGVIGAWVFFRAPNVSAAWHILSHIPFGWAREGIACGFPREQMLITLALFGVVAGFDLWQEVAPHWTARTGKPALARSMRWAGYWSAATSILLLGQFGGEQAFIYFQF